MVSQLLLTMSQLKTKVVPPELKAVASLEALKLLIRGATLL